MKENYRVKYKVRGEEKVQDVYEVEVSEVIRWFEEERENGLVFQSLERIGKEKEEGNN